MPSTMKARSLGDFDTMRDVSDEDEGDIEEEMPWNLLNFDPPLAAPESLSPLFVWPTSDCERERLWQRHKPCLKQQDSQLKTRVHHGYGEHHGILVTVVTVTVTVSNFSIPRTPCTLTRGVWVYHGVGEAQTAGACWGVRRAWAGVVIQRGWQRWQGDGDGGGTERVAVAASHGHATHPFLPVTRTGDAQTDRAGVSAGKWAVWGHRRQHGVCDRGQHGYSWGTLGSARGMGTGGDTKRVAAVAGRRQWGWYREGSGGGT